MISVVKHKPNVNAQTQMIPDLFLEKRNENQSRRAIVFLASPFAVVKNDVLAFLKFVNSSKVEFYFGVDCELIIDNNYASTDIQKNAELPLSPLPYITDFLKESVPSCNVSAYCLDLNTMPVLYSGYARANILRLIDPVRFTHSLIILK